MSDSGSKPSVVKTVSDVKPVTEKNFDSVTKKSNDEKRSDFANAFENRNAVVNKIVFEKRTDVVNRNNAEKISKAAVSNYSLETSEFNSEVRPEALLRSAPELHPD